MTKQELALEVFVTTKSFGRRQEFYYKARRKGFVDSDSITDLEKSGDYEKQVDDLVKLGDLKRNKAGAVSITDQGLRRLKTVFKEEDDNFHVEIVKEIISKR